MANSNEKKIKETKAEPQYICGPDRACCAFRGCLQRIVYVNGKKVATCGCPNYS